MALYSISQGGLVNALDTQQLINLLTGVMTDQQVTVANRLRVAMAGSAAGSGGIVGWTATGSPTGGPYNVGDIGFANDHHIWMCSVAGSPGTWVQLI